MADKNIYNSAVSNTPTKPSSNIFQCYLSTFGIFFHMELFHISCLRSCVGKYQIISFKPKGWGGGKFLIQLFFQAGKLFQTF